MYEVTRSSGLCSEPQESLQRSSQTHTWWEENIPSPKYHPFRPSAFGFSFLACMPQEWTSWKMATLVCTHTYIPGTFVKVRLHLIPNDQNRCGLYGLADHWSVKKPIDADLNLSSPDLKALRDAESMMCWGRWFHRSITRSKKWRLKSRQHLFLVILTVCSLVIVTLLSVNILPKLILDHPLCTLKTSNRSERFFKILFI